MKNTNEISDSRLNTAQDKKPQKKKRRNPQDFSKLARNCQVKIRLTEKEYLALKNAARTAGLCMADYVMACVNNKPIVRISGATQIRSELLREGKNLNYVLYQANIDRKLGRRIDWDGIHSSVAKVENNLELLSNLIKKWDADISEQIEDPKQSQRGGTNAYR